MKKQKGRPKKQIQRIWLKWENGEFEILRSFI